MNSEKYIVQPEVSNIKSEFILYVKQINTSILLVCKFALVFNR